MTAVYLTQPVLSRMKGFLKKLDGFQKFSLSAGIIPLIFHVVFSVRTSNNHLSDQCESKNFIFFFSADYFL